MVGANDIGNCGIRKAIEDIAETLGLLQILNPGADTFACEVSSQIFLFEPGLKFDGKSIERFRNIWLCFPGWSPTP